MNLQNVAAEWKRFSIAIMAVLGSSIVVVLATVVVLTTAKMRGMIRIEQSNRAMERARVLARVAFVPLVLEDKPDLERLIDAYSDDPDLTDIAIFDARGRTMASRRFQGAPPRDRRIDSSYPIVAPRGSSSRGAAFLGSVKISLSLERVFRDLSATLWWIAGMGVLLLLAAVGLDLALIVNMTRRLRNLVGEASLARELQRSNQELEQFAFVASHDLQEPLRKVVNFSQLLERHCRGKLDTEGEEYLRIIVSGVTRMSELIRDLLAFARVGTQGRPPQATDCAVVLRDALSALQDAVAERQARIVVEPLPVVMADAGQLEQLFRNLIGNAIKFQGQERPLVRVEARRHGAFWRFRVQDNGIGIDPKYHDRIFEMFKRLHGRGRYPGTGIGLAICKKIVERHGGRIWVESRDGQGAAFYFTLPSGEKP